MYRDRDTDRERKERERDTNRRTCAEGVWGMGVRVAVSTCARPRDHEDSHGDHEDSHVGHDDSHVGHENSHKHHDDSHVVTRTDS